MYGRTQSHAESDGDSDGTLIWSDDSDGDSDGAFMSLSSEEDDEAPTRKRSRGGERPVDARRPNKRRRRSAATARSGSTSALAIPTLFPAAGCASLPAYTRVLPPFPTPTTYGSPAQIIYPSLSGNNECSLVAYYEINVGKVDSKFVLYLGGDGRRATGEGVKTYLSTLDTTLRAQNRCLDVYGSRQKYDELFMPHAFPYSSARSGTIPIFTIDMLLGLYIGVGPVPVQQCEREYEALKRRREGEFTRGPRPRLLTLARLRHIRRTFRRTVRQFQKSHPDIGCNEVLMLYALRQALWRSNRGAGGLKRVHAANLGSQRVTPLAIGAFADIYGCLHMMCAGPRPATGGCVGSNFQENVVWLSPWQRCMDSMMLLIALFGSRDRRLGLKFLHGSKSGIWVRGGQMYPSTFADVRVPSDVKIPGHDHFLGIFQEAEVLREHVSKMTQYANVPNSTFLNPFPTDAAAPEVGYMSDVPIAVPDYRVTFFESPLQVRLKRAARVFKETNVALDRRHGGVDPSEVARVFSDLEMSPRGVSSLEQWLHQALGLYNAYQLESFVMLRAWSLPGVIPGAPPVKILMCGEVHDDKGIGANLMRYIIGQTVMEKKCVDLYLESGFDWTPIRAQSGGGALVQITESYDDMPGLRVHHVDVRNIITKKFHEHAAAMDRPSNHRDILRQSATRAPYDLYFYKKWFARATNIRSYLQGAGLFNITPSEYFMLVTGFDPNRTGDRTIAELSAQYDADLRTLRETGGEHSELAAVHDDSSVFRTMRQRFAKQRRRFLETTRIDERQLDNAIRGWVRETGEMKYSNLFHSVVDLFAFYRMFGRFTRRGHNDKPGCPMEQLNIIYVAGAFHVKNLSKLIHSVFGVNYYLNRGSRTGGVKSSEEQARDEVRNMGPLAVFG